MSANDDVADGITAHSIDLSRFAEDLVARVMPVLSRVERSLVADVAEIDPTAGTTLSNRQRRLKLLLEQTRGTIATAYRDIADTVGSDLHDVAKVSDKAGRKIINDAIGVEIQTVAIAPEQLRALADGTMIEGAVVKEHWDRQSESLRQKFTDRVQQGYMRGEPSTEIVNRVRGTKARGYADGIMVGTKQGAGALVRTSVQAVSNSARLESFRKNSDIIKYLQHLSTLDNKTTPQCRARSMLMWTLDGEPVGHDISFNVPPIHYNCLPGDALISPGPTITGLSKRWFDGDLVVIRTANDFEISCTPNHPILTDCGWLPAKVVNQTHRIVCDFRSKGPVLVDSQHDQVPTRIEDIADAFFRSSEVRSGPVVMTAKDFHGDGVDGEIAVVGSNRLLRQHDKAALEEHGFGFDLVGGNVPLDCLEGLGPLEPCLHGVSLPPPCRLGGKSQSLPFFRRTTVHPGLLLSGSVPQRDTALLQDPLYGTWTDAELFRDAINSDPFGIQFDDVVVVESRPYSGHVYNLETEKGVYTANGIINHNCRSTLIPVLRPWSEVSDKKSFDLPDGGKGTLLELVMAKSSKRQGAEAIESMQASMDGHVSADLDYESWLRTKSVEFQLDVLGPTKHKLWTAGKITFRDLVDQRGNPLTLAEIIAKVESGTTTAARGETMRKAREAAATVDDLEKAAAAAEKDARTQLNRSVRAGYVTDDERDALKRYSAARTAGDEPDLDSIQAYDARPEWLQDRINTAIEARREALKAKQQAGPAADYARRKAVAESAQRLKTTLHDPDSIAEWVPGQITDAELNDVPFEPWTPPENYNWLTAPGRKPRLPEPSMPQVGGKRQSAAIMLLEDDGRTWVYRLSAGLLAGLVAAANDGGDEGEEVPVPIVHAVPSGALESGMDLQAIAIREAWETLGLRADIMAHLGDYTKPSSLTRYYVARRTGGAPWRMGYEAQSVKLVPLDMLPAIASDDTDKAVAHDLAALYRKAILAGDGDLAAGLAMIIAQANDLITAAAKRKASLLREWVTQTAKGKQPSASAQNAYAALSGDERAAYAALAKEKAGS